MRIHKDERRTAYCDMVPELPGDLNLFVVNPGQRTAWHRHRQQTDKMLVIRGIIRFGVIDPDTKIPRYRDVSSIDPLVIPPGTWHGYENIGYEPAYILMYLDRKYDPSDEERMDEAIVEWTSLNKWLPVLVDDEWNKGQDPDPDNTA